MDVVGLSEGIKKNNEINGDNLYTMPYTSTGYVRRLAKNAISSVNYQWRKIFSLIRTSMSFLGRLLEAETLTLTDFS